MPVDIISGLLVNPILLISGIFTISTDAILYLYKINNIKITEFYNLLFSSIAQRQAVSVNEIEKDILINVKPKMYIPPHKRNIITNDI
jgi:hypothetical protein